MKCATRLLCAVPSALFLTLACSEPAAPASDWNALANVPEGFADGIDNTRTDEEIRAAVAGQFVTAEVDPAFAASPAATVTDDAIALWNAAAGWGDHAQAGYLTEESDPAFSASPAAGISAQEISQWNTAAAWGDHTQVGYLTAESDPKIGALSSGAVPRWDGSKLSAGSITDSNGKVGIGAAPGAGVLTLSDFARFGLPMESGFSKSCDITGADWSHTPPSAGACNSFCQRRGFERGLVTAEGTRSAGGGRCTYVTDFDTCATETMINSGCDSSAASFLCSCLVNNEIAVNGNVRVDDGYLQIDTVFGAPPATACRNAFQRGRMVVDPESGILWVCVNSGWIAK